MSLIELGSFVYECPGGEAVVRHSLKATWESAKKSVNDKVDEARQRWNNTVEQAQEYGREWAHHYCRWPTLRHRPTTLTPQASKPVISTDIYEAWRNDDDNDVK